MSLSFLIKYLLFVSLFWTNFLVTINILFEKMNYPKSKFLGIKTIPKKLAKNIELVDYNIIRL